MLTSPSNTKVNISVVFLDTTKPRRKPINTSNWVTTDTGTDKAGTGCCSSYRHNTHGVHVLNCDLFLSAIGPAVHTFGTIDSHLKPFCSTQIYTHRVSAFRNVQPELPLQRGPAGADRNKTSIRVNYTDLRQV